MSAADQKSSIAKIAEGEERPFRDHFWQALSQQAKEAWDDPFNLYAICTEALIRCRKNKSSKAQNVLDEVRPRLEELIEGLMPPEPDAEPGQNDLDDTDWPKIGVLKAMGYVTGERKGKSGAERRAVLEQVFFGPLLNVDSREYMAEWSTDASPLRLSKMAWAIAQFANNRRRSLGGNDDTAVSEWKNDLEWMKKRFYEGHFNFPWPPLD